MPSQIASDPGLAEFRRQINWRDETSFAHALQITKPYGKIDTILTWCKSELVDEWRWQMIEMAAPTRPGRYIFFFDSEQDCVAFSLKWC
jgi:hypothetical protein